MKTCAAIVLCAALLFPAFSVQAGESTNLAIGDYEYTLNEDGTAVITKYSGSAATVIIPDTLDGHFVSAIGKAAFDNNKELEPVHTKIASMIMAK